MLRGRFLLVLSFFLLVSCRTEKESRISPPPFVEICSLDQAGGPLGVINSIDYVCDTAFVLCTNTQVYLYNFSGSLIRTIGHTGRANLEYNSPRVVRSDSKRIVVWDGMLAKFVWFDENGQAEGECQFDRGVSDFIVDGDCLWIYSSNKESETCIVRLNYLSGESEDQDFLRVEGGHHILVRWMSRAPLCIRDGVVWSMPKNKLELCRSDSSERLQITSSSFREKEVSDPKAVINDRGKMEEYMCSTPFVVSILPGRETFLVLTAEGFLLKTKDGIDRSNRFYTIYSVLPSSGRSKVLVSFPQESFSPDQLMIGPDCFYCLSHRVVGEEDMYYLEKLVIN